MTELADDGVPVTVTCRVLQLSRQPYYRWLQDPVSDTELIEAYRANALFDAHRDDPKFGQPSMTISALSLMRTEGSDTSSSRRVRTGSG